MVINISSSFRTAHSRPLFGSGLHVILPGLFCTPCLCLFEQCPRSALWVCCVQKQAVSPGSERMTSTVVPASPSSEGLQAAWEAHHRRSFVRFAKRGPVTEGELAAISAVLRAANLLTGEEAAAVASAQVGLSHVQALLLCMLCNIPFVSHCAEGGRSFPCKVLPMSVVSLCYSICCYSLTNHFQFGPSTFHTWVRLLLQDVAILASPQQHTCIYRMLYRHALNA